MMWQSAKFRGICFLLTISNLSSPNSDSFSHPYIILVGFPCRTTEISEDWVEPWLTTNISNQWHTNNRTIINFHSKGAREQIMVQKEVDIIINLNPQQYRKMILEVGFGDWLIYMKMKTSTIFQIIKKKQEEERCFFLKLNILYTPNNLSLWGYSRYAQQFLFHHEQFFETMFSLPADKCHISKRRGRCS